MPYIKQTVRDTLFNDRIGNMFVPADPGELNYTLTMIALTYFKEHGQRYQQINDVLGALEGAKLEFYRRVVAPYEDEKIVENGDVYV